MKTHNGIIVSNKQERECIRIALEHAKRDLGFGWSGSYGGYIERNAGDKKRALAEAKKGERGIELLEFILGTL